MRPTPEKDIGWKIKRLYSAFSQFRDQSIQELEITSAQAFLLGYLSWHYDTPIYASDIGREFGLRHPTVSGLLSRMEQNGFIRYEADEDHRRKRIVLTEQALAVHEQIMENICRTNEIASANLSEKECAELHRLLDCVYENLHAAIRTMGDTAENAFSTEKAYREDCCEPPISAEGCVGAAAERTS